MATVSKNTGCIRILGAVAVAAGLWIIVGAAVSPQTVAFSNSSGDKMPQWLNILLGTFIVVLGLAGLGAHRLFAPSMSSEAATRFWIGAILVMIAIVILGAVAGDANDDSFPQGRWAAIVAALVFMVGGVAAVATGSSNAAIRGRLGGFLVLLVVTLFGVLATGLLLRGAEADSGSLTVGGIGIPVPSWLDNVMLGFFAVLIDSLAIFGWYRFARRV